MPVSVKVGGAWKTATAVFNKVGGVWKTAADMPVKIAGVWKTGVLASGAFESIATFTPTSGSSVTFSSIPSTYKSLQIRMFVRDTGFSDVWMRYNGDTAANYAWHRLRGTSNTATAAGVASNSYIVTGNSMSYTSQGGVSIIDIVDYASTSKNKTSKTLRGYDDSSDGQIILGSGLWMSTAAINSITLLLSGGTFSTGTTIALYGIKG